MITIETAKKNLFDFQKVCEDVGLSFLLDGGTLLGAIREGTFCKDDQADIDLTTLNDFWYLREELAAGLLSRDFSVYHKWDKDDYKKNGILATSQISFKRDGGKIDLMFKEKKGQWLWWTVFGKDKVVYKKVPWHFFSKSRQINFLGREFSMPAKFADYLEYRYGEWQIPIHRSGYSCYSNDRAIVKDYEAI